jgi:hypothetical protein
MALAEWLIPKPSLSAQAHYQHTCATLRAEGPSNTPQVIDLACSLAHQNMLQQAIIRQAIYHISELELTSLLMDSAPRPTLGQRLARLLGRKGV